MFHYLNEHGERIGSFTTRAELQQLADRGTVTPETVIEDQQGHTKFARDLGVSFPLPPTVPVTPLTPFPPPLDVRQRKARIHFWTVLCIVTFALATLGDIWVSHQERKLPKQVKEIQKELQQNRQKALGWYYSFSPGSGVSDEQIQEILEERLAKITLILMLIILPPYLLFYYFFLFRLWEEIPGEFARTTPGNAAGFALIPFFHLYWMFTAFWGLYKDMNKAMESYGLEPRFGEAHIKSVCVTWVIFFALGILLMLVEVVNANIGGRLSIYLSIFDAAVTISAYWLIRTNVLEFIDFKSSVGK